MDSRFLRAAFLAAMASVLVACGDDSADSEATAATTSSTNHPPVISGVAPTTVMENEVYDFKPTASDPDGDPLIFNVSGKPAWMTFDPQTGELTGSPNGKDVGKHRGIVVSVSDGKDETLLDPIDVEVLPASSVDNNPPQISGTPSDTATVGEFYDFIPTVSDVDGDPLTFQIQNQPSWADFDATIGRLSGTPAATGVYSDIVITVSDGIDGSSLGPFVIAVNEPPAQNGAPLITGIPDPDVLVGQLWSFEPQATDPDGDTLSFQVFNAPAWMSLNPATGQLSGTPAAGDAGMYTGISLVVSDGQASTPLPSFSVEVIPLNRAPTISGTPPASVAEGAAYSFNPQAADPDGDTLTFTIVNRPSWASFNASTGRLSGTPGSGTAGTYGGIEITVSDGQETATLGPFSIEVTSTNSAPVISGTPVSSVLEGSSYSFTPQASDSDGDTLTFSIVNQPAWASFDSTSGRLSGTPGAADVGTYPSISISVSDGQETASLPAFSIEVTGVNFAPVISGNPASSVIEGNSYSFVPQATDADGDTLAFSVQNLPVWASFSTTSGALSGTPGAGDVGLYANITITVSDGALTDTLGPFSIDVMAVATGTATLTWTPPTENTDGTPLNDLAGYKVYWGTQSGNYASSVTLDGAGITSYVVDSLLPGTTYYFATTAFNADGVESAFSNEASKTIP